VSDDKRRSGWEATRGEIDYDTRFRATLTDRDARAMSLRQLDDFYCGVALVVAAFEPDERFEGVAETQMERIVSVRFDERLRDFIDRLDRPPDA
jgi:hypothetical protein